MNDLVFVMCNLKLNQVKKQADDFGVEDDLSSDDDWIIQGEKHSNIDLLGAIDSATQRKNGNEDESDEEEIPNDAEIESYGTEDDLEIRIDDIGVVTSSSTNAHNIGVGTSSDTNNPLDECLRNNEEDEGNEADFSLHDTPTD